MTTKSNGKRAVKPVTFNPEQIDMANTIIDKAADLATATIEWFTALFLMGVVPTAMRGGQKIGEAIKEQILIPRLISETDVKFVKRFLEVGSKTDLEIDGKTQKKEQVYNSKITKRLNTLTNGYSSWLASDKSMHEQGDKLVKMQGNNAGVASTPEAKVEHVEARIALTFIDKRRAVIRNKTAEKRDTTDMLCLKQYDALAELLKGHRVKSK
tara:strand:+ start:157 stop:792 length:636 start_codon:yes stop_codon:yes gene_type:complete